MGSSNPTQDPIELPTLRTDSTHRPKNVNIKVTPPDEKKTAQRIKYFCMSSSMYLKFINGMANRFFYCENQSELQRGFKGETFPL